MGRRGNGPAPSGPLQAGCTSSPQEIVNSLGQAVEAEVATLPVSEPPLLSLHRHCPHFALAPRLSARSRHPADRRAPPRPLMHFLFPIPSVESLFPVSDLHCPFQATPL